QNFFESSPISSKRGKVSSILKKNSFFNFNCLMSLLSSNMSEMWIQCFTCCITQQPSTKRRRRIDRSMISNPTDFRHTAHIGSGDMCAHIGTLQNQMASKGGYDYAIPVNVQIPVVDVKN
ncbi:CDC42 small effector protein 2-like protein, partial [Dinothrombium tinctorium]